MGIIRDAYELPKYTCKFLNDVDTLLSWSNCRVQRLTTMDAFYGEQQSEMMTSRSGEEVRFVATPPTRTSDGLNGVLAKYGVSTVLVDSSSEDITVALTKQPGSSGSYSNC